MCEDLVVVGYGPVLLCVWVCVCVHVIVVVV